MVFFNNIYNKFSSSIIYNIFKFFIDIIKLIIHKLKHIIAIFIIILIFYILFADKISFVRAESIYPSPIHLVTEIEDADLHNIATDLEFHKNNTTADIFVMRTYINKWIVQYVYVPLSDNFSYYQFMGSSGDSVYVRRINNSGNTYNSSDIFLQEIQGGNWSSYTMSSFYHRINNNISYLVPIRVTKPIYDVNNILVWSPNGPPNSAPSFRNADEVLDLEHNFGDHLYIDMNSVQYSYSLQEPPFYSQTTIDLVARVNGTDYHVPIIDDWIFIDPRAFPENTDIYDPSITDNMWVITIPKYWLFQNGYIDNNSTVQLFFSWNNIDFDQEGSIHTNTFNYSNLSSERLEDINNRIGSTFQSVQTRIQEIANRQREWEENEHDNNLLSWFSSINQNFTNSGIFTPISTITTFLNEQFVNWNYNTNWLIPIHIPFTNKTITLSSTNTIPDSIGLNDSDGDLWFVQGFYWFVISAYILNQVYQMWGKIKLGELAKLTSSNLYASLFK